jgi:predicted dehydrogenase
MPQAINDTYGLPPVGSQKQVPAPPLPYAPADPRTYRPKIGLIGCGGISIQHLRAYSAAGYTVSALCDVNESRARDMQKKFYPDASVFTDYRRVIAQDDIEVLDMTAHPDQRAAMFGPAIEAGKHILSQKPFVTDLDFGMGIVEKAEKKGVRLAVNQNGRWAPHWSWIRHAIAAGLLGEVSSVRLAVNWDHTWIAGSVFEDIHYIILYDFGIHWFDITSCFLKGRKPLRVRATAARAPAQRIKPPLLSQAIVEYEDAQASLFFDASTLHGGQDATFVAGSRGSAWSTGPDLNAQEVGFATAEGKARPALEGAWFPDGFHGSMGELLCAVEERREPYNSARDNLDSLALCFAALASAESGAAVAPGAARRLARRGQG